MFAVMQGIRLFSSVFAITERRDMGLYEEPLFMSLLGFVIGCMLSHFHNMRVPMCFRCLIFCLSGTCKLLFLVLFYCLLDLSCGECNVISLYVFSCSANGSGFFVCVACLTVFVNSLLKQFAICFGVVVILLLNVIELFSVVGDALLGRPCIVLQRECVCCTWDPSERLDAPSICFVCVFCMSKVISSFKSMRAESQACDLLMLFLCVILHTMWSCKTLQLLYFTSKCTRYNTKKMVCIV